MPKPPFRIISKLNFGEQTPVECEGEVRLETIIQTFRENNIRLLKRIEECDRQRESEQNTRRRKQCQQPHADFQGEIPRELKTGHSKRHSLMRVEAAVK